MNPRQYEEYVCEVYAQRGYTAELTSYGSDYGVDVFASKGNQKIAIQAKMYGNGRKINRKMIMELYGAKAYFDCTHALMITDGVILPDALEVAKKLDIGIVYLTPRELLTTPIGKISSSEFDKVWEQYIMPLEGKVLANSRGQNTIVKVDWTGITRITSTGNEGKIDIEIFRSAVEALLSKGFISRDEINQNYVGRASSGVVMILSEVPYFIKTSNPLGLHLQKS